MNMRLFWTSLCLASAFALSACGGGDAPTASNPDQYREALGPNGERVVIVSPLPGQVVRIGDNVQFVLRLENATLHTTPSPTALQAAQAHWHAKHTADAMSSTEQKTQITLSDATTQTTPTVGWLHLSAVANHPTAGTAISHVQGNNLSPLVQGDNLIFSVPAVTLVGNFADHHLMCAGTFSQCTGTSVASHLSVQDVDGNTTGASTSVQLTVVQ